ncbi:MAG: DUF6880 family protein [Sulfitobacter sp.]|uniref:DUF6880 family protein n=1 Tax=Sulfitobacter sp. TaxID=1903071 RepID=UPI004059A450
MSKKTLNKANLANLGADRLADLLIEVSAGSADMKRRLRLELSHNLGPSELSADVRKRLVSIRRAKTYVGWRRRKALIKDLNTQADMIILKIAPAAPTEAFELLWQFLELAPSVYNRVDDTKGDVAQVFGYAISHIDEIATRAGLDPTALAERVWEAVQGNECGEFDGIIGHLGPALGDAGMEHLKRLILTFEKAPLEADGDHAALRFLRDLRSRKGNYAAEQKSRMIKMWRQELAVAQGDTSAYIAQYSAADLKRPSIAGEVAALRLEQGQPDQALAVLTDARPEQNAPDREGWDLIYIEALIASERFEDAQKHRWDGFLATLNPVLLRAYLRVLPDFEDIEFEEAAKAHAARFGDVTTALGFFLAWPDLGHAARLVEQRATEIDGNLHHVLGPAAEALRTRYPLAAALLWRAMVNETLRKNRKDQYGQAAHYLMDCAAADLEINDYGTFQSHGSFVDALRKRHGQKAAFWTRVS